MEKGNRYRTKDEMIKYFEYLAFEFGKEAHREQIAGNEIEAERKRGKAEAYEIAAFELKHNME